MFLTTDLYGCKRFQATNVNRYDLNLKMPLVAGIVQLISCRAKCRTCSACLWHAGLGSAVDLGSCRAKGIYGPLPFCNINVVVNVGCSRIYGLFLVTCHLAWMNSAQRLAYRPNVISVTAPCQSQSLPVYPCLPSC